MTDEQTQELRVGWRVPVATALVLITLFTFQNYIAPVVRRGDGTFWRTFLLQLIVWGTWLLLCPLVFRAARKWRRQRQRVTASAMLGQLWTALLVAALHSIIASTIRWLIGIAVLTNLVEVIANTIFSNLATNLLRYGLISAAYHAVAYHHEVRDREVRAARLEGALVQAKLDSLQGRLHPHFLFNTLNSIGALIHDNPAGAEQMLGSLSELLRASLQADPSREVKLTRELDLIRQYVEIQQMRFTDRLRVSIDVAPDVMDAYVPHLVLQPLVENAIRHGIAPREAPGHVRIAAGRQGDRLQLLVEDDGLGVADGPRRDAASGFGLSGTQARLQHLYGDGARVEVQPRVPTGVRATVDLPYHTTPVTPA